MGYFSMLDQFQKENSRDREDVNLKDQMIRIILEAYPKKSYTDLASLSEASLRGLYGHARKVLKSRTSEKNEEDMNYNLDDYEEYRR